MNITSEDNIEEYIVKIVEVPEGWEHITDEDKFPITALEHDKNSGYYPLAVWKYKNDESTLVVFSVLNETEKVNTAQFRVTTIEIPGLHHRHETKTFESAVEVCSMAMYTIKHKIREENIHYDNVEQSRKQTQIEELELELDVKKEEIQAAKKRASELKNKNEILRSQMNTLVETVSANYTNGNWHNMSTQPQFWRPPTASELRSVGKYIDEKLLNDGERIAEENTEQFIEKSFIIVLDKSKRIREIDFSHCNLEESSENMCLDVSKETLMPYKNICVVISERGTVHLISLS